MEGRWSTARSLTAGPDYGCDRFTTPRHIRCVVPRPRRGPSGPPTESSLVLWHEVNFSASTSPAGQSSTFATFLRLSARHGFPTVVSLSGYTAQRSLWFPRQAGH